MCGSKWLCHLSLHCFPMRPGRAAAIALQFLAPFSTTICRKMSSSSLVHGPLDTKESFLSSSQRLKHYISDLPGMHLLTLFHRWSPNLSTRLTSLLSYYSITNAMAYFCRRPEFLLRVQGGAVINTLRVRGLLGIHLLYIVILFVSGSRMIYQL
jgi:hypothetical protein